MVVGIGDRDGGAEPKPTPYFAPLDLNRNIDFRSWCSFQRADGLARNPPPWREERHSKPYRRRFESAARGFNVSVHQK